jgi:PKD repeat protein
MSSANQVSLSAFMLVLLLAYFRDSMQKLLKFLALACMPIGLFAQHLEPHQVYDQQEQDAYIQAHPELWNEADQAQREHKERVAWLKRHGDAARGQIYTIPVVFHVIHENGPENISLAQIEDAVRVLNRDFRLQNPDTSDIVGNFKNIAADIEIEFRLAKLDPNGNRTEGVTRTLSSLTNEAGENVKSLVRWDRSRYLNIWVVGDIASGAAGYTYYPRWSGPGNDGIVVLHNYVGSIGTASPRTSRTLTHEVGHWINLPHLWGSTNSPGLQSNCGTDDGIGDTPNTIGWRSCNLNGATCDTSELDNVQNYMEYSYCSNMFTQDQAVEMRAALTSSTAERNNLITTETHKLTGISELLSSNWTKNKLVFCEGEEVTFQDKSYYEQNSWNWSFEGGTPATSSTENPTVRYDSVGSYNVSLTVSNGSESVTEVKAKSIHVVPKKGFFTPYREGFENPLYMETRWNIINFDETGAFGWLIDQEVSASGGISLKNNNVFSESGRVDHFVSSSMDWSSFEGCEVDFKVAYRQYTQDNSDVLRLYVSHDCGETWDIRWAKAGSSLATGQPTSTVFKPQASEFREEIVTSFQPEDFVDNVLLRFEFISNGGNQLYLDDIFIAGVYNRTPVLNYPEDGADSVDQNVLLDWKPILGVGSYELELDTSARFNSSLLVQESKAYLGIEPFEEDSEFETENLLPGVTYHWRVRSIHTGTPSDWSPTWSFVVSTTGEGENFVEPEEVPINTGMEEVDQIQMKIYPNPLSEGDLLKLETELEVELVSVMNLQGAVVHTEIRSKELLLPNLPKGVYLLQVEGKGHTLVRKLILN